MTIEFSCQQCDNTLRVGDENAGKTSRCPRCGTPVVVPAVEIPSDPVDATSLAPEIQSTSPVKRFLIETDFGQTYGPVTLAQLDQWVTEGRITPQYVIREEGASGGFYASQMYPALVEGAPLSAKTGQANNPGGQHTREPIAPTRINLGDAFDHAFVVFKNNMGLLVGTSVVTGVVNLLSNRMESVGDATRDQGTAGLLYLGSGLVGLIAVYLFIGQAQICLKLARGFEASFVELFGAGMKFVYVCLFSLLIGIAGFALLSLIFLFTNFFSPFLGLMITIVLIVAAWLALWPAYFLLIDGQANIFSSFAKSAEISTPNIGNTFVIFLASIGLTIAGLLALCIGVIFSNAFIALLWATAYLMMSGQLQPKRHG